MASATTTLLHFCLTTIPCHRWRYLAFPDLQLPFSDVWSIGVRDKPTDYGFLFRSRRNIISKTRTEVYRDVFWSDQPGIERQDQTVEGDEEVASKVICCFPNEIEEKIQSIKSMLRSMEDGEISISAYDTAWVALVEDINGSGVPQFPSSLQWIVENQLPDGSWGDRYIFSAHDRILNTLACVITLKSWKIYPKLCEKGMVFIRENISKLESENDEHMPIGFEVAFPSLMDIARRQDLKVPTDSPVIDEIYAKRKLKLTRIPKDMMHVVPTTLLHSLEGMADLDWEKLLKLQCKDGSFLFSPSSTAFALMQTKDERCLKYLKKAVETFNGGVPNVYPVDLFEHIWAVDRLERLGISRYFRSEIKECLNYVYRYWTEDGICWARNSRVHDIDDTAMGFRLLRLHGHEVSPDAFRHFEKGGEFFCFAGQSNQAITGIFNLYRASQVLFPGEKILEEAKTFAYRFLREKEASNQLVDKWIITKDLPGEVGYALDFSWYGSLPRVEARFYIEQYGGDDDVWIGKTLYRMPYVNNDDYLDLAKLDFNNCQALHQREWITIQKWYTECNLGEVGVGRKELLQSYFVAAASIFEPERACERLAWARSAVLVEAVMSYMEMDTTTLDQKRAFVNDFNNSIRSCSTHDNNNIRVTRKSERKTTGKELMEAILTTLNSIAVETLAAHCDRARSDDLLCASSDTLNLMLSEILRDNTLQRISKRERFFLEWVRSSWNGLRPECFVRSFVGCGKQEVGEEEGCILQMYSTEQSMMDFNEDSCHTSPCVLRLSSTLWKTWLLTWCPDEVEKKKHRTESSNGREIGERGWEGEGELLVHTINLCAGRSISEEHSSHPHYQRLLHLNNAICHHFRLLLNSKGHGKNKDGTGAGQIDPLMQELVQIVLQNSDSIDPDIKRVFLTVAKSFYYAAHCTPATINHHIAKVLFQSVA